MMVPRSRPQLKKDELLARIAQVGNIDRKRYPLVVAGIRGYYLDSMGVPGKNDIAVYDDAIFLHFVWEGKEYYATFNGNTDPSRQREGMATLKPGIWYAYKLGIHKTYLALIQRMGKVTVQRHKPGGVPMEFTDFFGINIHKGGYNTTSSEGCQTVHPDQWQEFILACVEYMRMACGDQYKKRTVPYVLMEEDPATKF